MGTKKIVIPLLVGGLVLIIIVGVGGILLTLTRQSSPQLNPNTNTSSNLSTNPSSSNSSSSTNSSPSESINPNPSTTASYKDGTYTDSESYDTPDGVDNGSINVKLVIANNVISSVTVTPTSSDRESQLYERRFSQGISSKVVGKTIDNAYVFGNVNGSSLTGTGFNAALDKIKQQAAS